MPGLIGQVEGIKKNLLHRLEKLYQRRLRGGQAVSYELAEELCELSLEAKREISLLMDFQGRVELVVIGDAEELDQVSAISLPSHTDGMAKRYCIHTHLGWKTPSLGDQVTLLQFHFPVMAILMAGMSPKIPGGFSSQFGEHPRACDGVYLLNPVLNRESNGEMQRSCELSEPMTARKAGEESLEKWLDWSEPVFESHRSSSAKTGERAFLLGIYTGGQQGEAALQDSLDELAQLAQSAGAVVVDRAIQTRRNPEPGSYIGSGKADELAFAMQQRDIDLVITDDELSPVQQRNLERILRVKVIDRTELILDIFAQRAQSREGKIQVELAQLQYELPRLKGRGRTFSQQTAVGAKGGIATRGPGETKLETDRRLLRDRVTMLEKEAMQVVKHRQFQRQSRKHAQTPLIALVGYTNAGKSTLMRRLTQADVLVEDRLFATLDPTVRKLYLGNSDSEADGAGNQPDVLFFPQEVLLSDTVGFIRKLPTFLIQAFRATLEEAASADLLWHVWDISHPERHKQAESVHEVLNTLFEELDVVSPPIWTLCNKIDKLDAPDEESQAIAAEVETPVFPISAGTGEGIPELLEATRQFLARKNQQQWGGEASYATSAESRAEPGAKSRAEFDY
jgi:GTP-binding protein HflX